MLLLQPCQSARSSAAAFCRATRPPSFNDDTPVQRSAISGRSPPIKLRSPAVIVARSYPYAKQADAGDPGRTGTRWLVLRLERTASQTGMIQTIDKRDGHTTVMIYLIRHASARYDTGVPYHIAPGPPLTDAGIEQA